MNQSYEAPQLIVVGTVHELTLQEDKIGSSADFITRTLSPTLDGRIQPDPTPSS